jgi:PHD/YefM family antitoxin component YafN of YafNO toxin-antitoxin module
MKVDTRDIRSASQVARNFGQVADDLESGRTIVIMRNNAPLGVLAPVALMDRLDEIEEREEDVRLLAAALVRSVTSKGALVSLDDLAAELGVDLNED